MATSGEILRDDRELPSEIRALYPFPSKRIDLGQGARMHFVEAGSGPPVVLLHGNPTWSFLWRRFLPKLADAGFRAIAPDHVGFGLSDKVLDESYFSIERHIENLGRFLDAEKLEDITLVVHDWSGPIGLGYAGRNPHRIRRLAILNTLAFAPRRHRALSPWHALFASRLGRPLSERMNLLVETALRFGVAKRLGEDVLEAYRFPFETPATRIAPLAFVRMVPNGPDHKSALTMAAIEDNLRELKEKPAALFWGQKDRVFPKYAPERWKKALPGISVLKRYADAGHFLQEDAPDEIAADLVAFLKST